MNMTPEFEEMMTKKMSHYLTAYWETNATDEQKAKATTDGKTIGGAMRFIKSIAKHIDEEEGMRVMPDDFAYWAFMEYMEHEEEGAVYRTPKEIDEEAKRKAEQAKREKERLEKKAKELSVGSLFDATIEDVKKMEAEQKRIETQRKEDKKRSQEIENKITEVQFDLFEGI